MLSHWLPWALGSALFAALTALFAKIGVSALPPDYATFIRTLVIAALAGLIVFATGQWMPLAALKGKAGLFLLLSGLATGASWLCYFRALKLGEAARVAPVDKLSVVMVAVLGATLLGENLSGLNWLGVALVGVGAVLVAV